MTLNIGVPEADKHPQPAPVPATLRRGSGLMRYETLKRALAECHRIDEAKEIRDRASALSSYAAQAEDRELLRMAAEITLRAERRAGALLAEMAESGAREDGPGRPEKRSHAATLKSLGIKKNQSSRWQLAASVPEAEFNKWLEGLGPNTVPTSSALRALAKVGRAATVAAATAPQAGADAGDLEELAAAGRSFGVIYADPPWRFETRSAAGQDRAPEAHYPTMTYDRLADMAPQVQGIAAPDCALLLWASDPLLPEALRLIEAWGFTFKTVAFTWAKTNPKAGGTGDFGIWHRGLGYWTRANPETCLLATRGFPKRLDRDVDQLIVAPRGPHSAKPEEARKRIERLVAGPYLELFARETHEGWTVWGNQVQPNQGETT